MKKKWRQAPHQYCHSFARPVSFGHEKNIMPIYCVPMFVEFVILGVAKTADVLSVSNEAGELTELSKYILSKIF